MRIMNWDDILIASAIIAGLVGIIELIRSIRGFISKKPRLFFSGLVSVKGRAHPSKDYLHVKTFITNLGDSDSKFIISAKLRKGKRKKSIISETYGYKPLIKSKETQYLDFSFKLTKALPDLSFLKIKFTYSFILNGKKTKSSPWIRVYEDF